MQNQLPEPATKYQILIDGDLSETRITDLVLLKLEEERLDYKERLEWSGQAKKRSKTDLICDIVAMANTNGGYMIFGVRDDGSGAFTPVGVNSETRRILTQENVQTWLSSFVDASLRVLVKPVKCLDCDMVSVFVPRARLPVPFRVNGQYLAADGKPVTKFCEGELFVRHGSKSERAVYEDWLGWAEAIREDERRKGTQGLGASDVVSRLDAIIGLLGGASPSMRTLDLAGSSEEDIEDKIAQLLSLQNPIALKRALKREFDFIVQFLDEQKRLETYEQVLENLERTFNRFLKASFAVWVAAIEYEQLYLGEQSVDLLHRIYCRAVTFGFEAGTQSLHPIWLQSRIMFVVYCFGALAVEKDKPSFSQLLMDRGNPFDEYYSSTPWFRYVLGRLAEVGKAEKSNLLVMAQDFVKDNAYFVNQFESEEKLRDSLCQFDFLQCAYILAGGRSSRECWPSFSGFYKHRIEPIVQKIVETSEVGSWVPKIGNARCAEIIKKLDEYAQQVPPPLKVWDLGGWQNPLVRDFLKEWSGKSEGTSP